MADAEIKKVTVLKKDLGKLGTFNEYVVRYRIVSEDKNRTSHWSPSYVLKGEDLPLPEVGIAGYLSVSAASNLITVVWSNELNRPAYDIFISFDGEPLKFSGTTSLHSHSFLKTGVTSIAVQIQVEGIAKAPNDALKIYNSGTRSVTTGNLLV